MACPFLGASGTHFAGTMSNRPETTPAGISNPGSPTQVQSVENAFIGPLQHTPPCAITDTPVTPDPLCMMAYCPEELEHSDELGDAFNSLFSGMSYSADGYVAQPYP